MPTSTLSIVIIQELSDPGKSAVASILNVKGKDANLLN